MKIAAGSSRGARQENYLAYDIILLEYLCSNVTCALTFCNRVDDGYHHGSLPARDARNAR